jgi:vacuolar protein sorting-associated protein 51
MSTIASPRDPTTPIARRISYQGLTTPTSSSRPSLEAARSQTSSPIPNQSSNNVSASSSSAQAGVPPAKRTNRAALREYYNLKKQQQAAGSSGTGTPLLEVTDPLGDQLGGLGGGGGGAGYYSEVPASELDAAEFDAEMYVRRALAESGMEELLRLYTRVLGEVRALDAEKKALVYDNYSKLISATETIRKVFATSPYASETSTAAGCTGQQLNSSRCEQIWNL